MAIRWDDVWSPNRFEPMTLQAHNMHLNPLGHHDSPSTQRHILHIFIFTHLQSTVQTLMKAILWTSILIIRLHVEGLEPGSFSNQTQFSTHEATTTFLKMVLQNINSFAWTQVYVVHMCLCVYMYIYVPLWLDYWIAGQSAPLHKHWFIYLPFIDTEERLREKQKIKKILVGFDPKTTATHNIVTK